MALQILTLAVLAAVTQASVIPVARVDTPDYTSFAYDVADPYTGDFKSQHETRVGSSVSGQYSLLDSDGTRRTVDYTADDATGFNAVVRKDAGLGAAHVGVAPIVPNPAVVAASPAVVEARTVVDPVIAAPSVAAIRSAPFVVPHVAPAVVPHSVLTPTAFGRSLAVASPYTGSVVAPYTSVVSPYAASPYAASPYAASPYAHVQVW